MNNTHETLMKYLGINGQGKCEQFVAVDGPDAESINTIFEQAESYNQVTECAQMIDDAYILLNEGIPALQAALDSEINSLLDIGSNPYQVYKLLLKLTQMNDFMAHCKTILVTKIVVSTKKGFAGKEKISGVLYLAFDNEGKLVPGCTFDNPFETTLDDLVALVDNMYNNKTVGGKSNMISFQSDTSKKKSSKRDIKRRAYDGENEPTFEKTTNNTSKGNKNDNSYFVISKKKLVMGVSLTTLAVSLLSVPICKKLIEAEKSKVVLEFLKLNPDTVDKVADYMDIEAALTRYNLAYDRETKELIEISNESDVIDGDTETASSN